MATRAKKNSGPYGPALFAPGPWFPAALAIAAAVLWIYTPVLHGDWLWDDNIDITENKITQSPTGLWNIWFQPGSQLDYYPLKASAQWLQWRVFQGDTFGYHLTNVLLHLASALLVWRLLAKLGLRLAWLGGLLFAIHPAQVESVAWIAELKNTLSTPLFLLAMVFYLDYDTRGSRRDYLLALTFFLLAMLAKTSVAMFPLVILLFAWWKRGRIVPDDLTASAPFFAISAILGVVTLHVNAWYGELHHAVYHARSLGFLSRLALTGSSIAFYLAKSIWPVHMLPIYPQWQVAPPVPWQFLPLLGVAGLLAWFWKKREGWGRHALLGSGFFLIMLAPFVSIVVPGYMDFTWVMDHFLYVPIIGLIGLVVAAMEMLDGHAPRGWRIAAWVLVAVAVAMLTAKSRGYAKRYLSHETLWSYTLRHNPNAWPAHHNLGNVDYISGRLDEAMTEYEAVLRLNPGHAQSLCNIGHIKQVKGDLDGALDAYDRAIAVSPGDGQTYYSRALVRQARGDWAAALADLQLSAKLSPDTMYGDYTHVLTWRIRIAQNQRQQADLELAAALSNGWFSGPDEWVTQVARFLLGQTDETTLFAASASPLQDKAAEQYCEAWYFAGLKRLAEGDRAGALADFQKCLDTHERTSAEYMLALAELKALGPPR